MLPLIIQKECQRDDSGRPADLFAFFQEAAALEVSIPVVSTKNRVKFSLNHKVFKPRVPLGYVLGL